MPKQPLQVHRGGGGTQGGDGVIDPGLGQGNDVFDGANGTVNGVVLGNGGEDDLTAGAEGDVLNGGSDNDTLTGADRDADGHNPLCGDRLHIFVKLADDVIEDLRFEGSGCAISTASASVMTQSVKGKSLAEAKELFERFHALVTGKVGVDDEDFGKLAVFGGVSEFPVRVKCATLCWHTLQAALDNEPETISTE